MTHRLYKCEDAFLLKGDVTEQALIDAVKAVSESGRGTLGREIPKILRAQAAGKKGPFLLSGGVQVMAYGEWLLVMKKSFRPIEVGQPSEIQARPWSRKDFEELVERSLIRGMLQHAPFWSAFDPEQKHRNVLVASGVDPLWRSLTGQRAVRVIHAEKLLQRWKDPQQVLWLQPLWPTSH